MYTPPEPLKCCPDLFERFWMCRGSYCSDKDAIRLAHEALSEGVVLPTGHFYLHFPEPPSELLSNWETLEYWLQDIHFRLSVEDIWTPSFDYWDEGSPEPFTVFPTIQSLKNSVLELAKGDDSEEMFPSVWGATITDGSRTVELVYGDLDGWVLGHASSIDVFDSFDSLNEELGYFRRE